MDHREIGSLAERSAQGVVELVVPDLAAAVAFYTTLGFEAIRRTDGFAALAYADAYLLIAEDAGAACAPRWVNLRILVPDVDRLWALVKPLDLAVIHPIGDRAYGLRDFTLRDPFGFDVRFAQRLP